MKFELSCTLPDVLWRLFQALSLALAQSRLAVAVSMGWVCQKYEELKESFWLARFAKIKPKALT